jgi:cysteinyl-tRNA synthetase
MSTEYLGPNFDIHGGGADLVFPHHENEIAQSECAHKTTYANYWLHVAMLNIDGEKMSKSLGNFWTIRDVLKHHHPEVLRYFMMTAHYRKPVNYSASNLDTARERIEYLYETREAIAMLWDRIDKPDAIDDDYLNEFLDRVHEAMDDDFNTSVFLAVLNEVAREANELLNTKKLGKKPDIVAKIAALDEFFVRTSEFSGILGDNPTTVLNAIRDQLVERLGLDGDEIDKMVADRDKARAEKDWDRADELRDELASRKVILKDSPEGTTWRIKLPAESNH